MKNFPKVIYVTRENEGTADEYLNVRASIDEPSAFDATTRVARYQLLEVGEVVVSRTYEPPKAKGRRR
jgi:hypothetical protein